MSRQSLVRPDEDIELTDARVVEALVRAFEAGYRHRPPARLRRDSTPLIAADGASTVDYPAIDPATSNLINVV
jgi:hypothetical protein